ncbi:MAG: HDIG domain-containing protein [Bacteroidales bacterium]|nr:HDIG domain-containing protein [Bacteroidales bacterium]
MKQKILTNIFFTFIATLVIVYFFPHLEVNHYKFEEGRPWNYAKLIAPFDIPILPDSATILYVRDSLSRTFVPVFERDPEAVNTVITSLMAHWTQADANEKASESEAAMRRKAVAYLRSAYTRDVIDNEYGERIDTGTLPSIRITQSNTVRPSTTSGITYPVKILSGMAHSLGTDSAHAWEWIHHNELESMLIPNLPYSQETSERLYQSDLDRYTAIKGVIQQGQTIVDKGTVITPQDYTNLLTYERMVEEELSAGDHSQWLMWLGQFLYVAVILTSLLVFLYYSAPDVWADRSAILFILLSITLFFLIGIALDDSLGMGIYLVPFAIVPVLMIVFFDAPTALFVSLALALLCGGTVSFPLEFLILQMMASIAAIYTLKDLTQRSQLLRMSLMVMVAYMLGYLAIELMFNDSFEGWQWRMVVYLLVSGALSSIAYILMVAVERVFGFVSAVTLIELADTNNPLLRELSQECPGTFQHSMAVGNLATDAAIKIHANEQLVRAGAMYHDIGKMNNPNFFTENQRGVNPHDSLPIERSAQIIIGHVADGLARADKAGLPSVIKDFIAQHHGHGKAKYFYYTYCKQHPGEEVDPEPFTYPGPNPQSRETSLLMMADSVEAASRSLQIHTPEAIRDLVNKIIDGQIADGLHNESPLHFRDVGIIKEAFIRRLMTMYHSRIVYPEDPNKKPSPQETNSEK